MGTGDKTKTKTKNRIEILQNHGVLGVVMLSFIEDLFCWLVPFTCVFCNSRSFIQAFLLFNRYAFSPPIDGVSVPFPSANEARLKAWGNVFLANLGFLLSVPEGPSWITPALNRKHYKTSRQWNLTTKPATCTEVHYGVSSHFLLAASYLEKKKQQHFLRLKYFVLLCVCGLSEYSARRMPPNIGTHTFLSSAAVNKIPE